MTIPINTYGDLLAALHALSADQLNQPILAAPDDKPILGVSHFHVTDEDMVQTDEAIELKSAFTDEEIAEWEYPVIYRRGTAFLDLAPLATLVEP